VLVPIPDASWFPFRHWLLWESVHARKDVCRKDLFVDATSKPNTLSPRSELSFQIKMGLVIVQVCLIQDGRCSDNVYNARLT